MLSSKVAGSVVAVVALGLALLAATTAACGADEPLASEYIPGVVEDLRAAGLTAEELSGANSRLRFSVDGKSISVSDGTVHVFAFPDPATAETEAAYVSGDGSAIRVPEGGGRTGTSIYEWVATPRYYKKEELIILYIGDDAAVTGALVELFGPQFAGG